MAFHLLDWSILLLPLLAVAYIAWRTNRYVRSVADFLAAGRCAGRYLVCNAVGEASAGAISVIAIFEMTYQAGFAVNWWGGFAVPVSMLVTLTGFVIYRYRETRAMTVAQFLEVRYSRRFRIFMGMLAFAAGVINYGIFPAVGARFFVHFLGLPPAVDMLGVNVPTFGLVMAGTVGLSLIFTLMGGQLTAMVTDCVEGIISGIMYLVVACTLLFLFSWSRISESMGDRPPGLSLLNPFDTAGAKDFNLWYMLIAIATMVYTTMAWQGGHGFNNAALNPHEAKMGRILSVWRGYAKGVMIILLAICAYAYMHHPAYATEAHGVQVELSHIENEAVRTQMTVPVALREMLPIGIKGMFASIMLFALIACDSSYLHSWGSIFIQDCVLPFRTKPLSPAQHIRWLRLSITGVAMFSYAFSFVFRQTDYILMFFALTGAIFLGGAGAVIIGGLYTKWGTAAGAWAGMLTGSMLAVCGILLQQFDPQFPVNGQYMSAIAMTSAVFVYLIVSFMTYNQPFNLDRMLHRGRYAVAEPGPDPLAPVDRVRWRWSALLGINEQFTRADRWQSIAVFAWSVANFAVFVVLTLWNLLSPWPLAWWSRYWHIAGILIPLGLGVVTTVWFTVGGISDLRRFFAALRGKLSDVTDNGVVQDRAAITSPTASYGAAGAVPEVPASP